MKKSIFLFFAAILCAVGMNAYGATQRYIYVGLSNNYHQWKNESQWGINHWGGTGGGVVPGSKITDLQTTITHSGCTFHMYRMYVYDDNKNFEFKGNDGWWDCKKENISISGTTKNAILFRDNDGGDGGNPTFYQTDYKETSTVSLSASAASVSVGEEVTLTPTLTSNAEFNEIKSITYSVGTGATVSTDGKFVATAAGTYTVTATITYNPKHFTGITTEVNNLTCEIVVSEVVVPHPVTDVTVNPTSVTIKQGATATLTATVAPSNADDPSVTWSSDNQSVATVDNGIVTAVAPGTANITVTTVDGGFTATCAVKVKPLQYTFYAINSAQWPTVAAHYWEGADGGSAWPGANMVKESETINGFDIYSITISSDFVNIMFTNQIDGDNNKKTADLTTEGNNGKYYDIKDAKWYASLSEVPVSYDYYVIGTINSWGLKDAAYGLELNEDVYEKEVALAIGKHELKINNGTWDNASTFGYDNLSVAYEEVSRGSGEGDNNIVIDLAEAKTITVKLDKNTKKITLEGLTEKAPEPTYDYYLTGSLVGGWGVKQQGIEKDGELYKATFTELNAGTYEFKITDGDWEHQWNYNNLGAAYEEVSQGVDGEGKPNGNIKIVTEEAKNITVIFDATAGKITLEGLTLYVVPLTYTVTVPAGTEKCYIAGAFAQSNWNTFVEMTKVGDEDKFTIEIVGAKETDEYKYACQADWAYAEVIDGGGNRTNWSELDEVTAWGKPVIVTYELKGVGGWDQPGIELVQNPDPEKASEYMLTCQAISATDAIKVVRLEDGVIKDYYGNGTVKDGVQVTVEYDDQANIKLPAGTYNFYFDTAEPEKKLWIEAATDCATEPTIPTITLTTGDNSAVIAANIGNTVDVVIERSFTANDGYYTLCVPFNMPASVIGKAYSLGTITEHVSGQGININLKEENELSAGMPYLVLPKADMTQLVVENVTIAEDDIAGQGVSNVELNVSIFFQGYYSAPGVTTNGTTEYYVGNNGYLYNGEVEIRGLSGLFTITDTEGNPTRVRARVVAGENGVTSVEDIITNAAPQKVIENGQLIIIRNGEKYNVQGVRL